MQIPSLYLQPYFLVLLFGPSSALPLFSHDIQDLFSGTPSLLVERRQNDSGTFAITGIKGRGVQPRLEIRDLERDPDVWNIYLLGMQRFQDTDQEDKLSYYQICGIHGRPYRSWDGVQPTGNGLSGYCTHVSTIFLPWHRPYLALYEQILYEHILDAVDSFPAGNVRDRYASAAHRWRLPYWDWAAPRNDGSSVYPDSLAQANISVTLSSGNTTIRNPLFSYRFHQVSAEDFFYNPYASWPETLRFPTNQSSSAVSQNDQVREMMDNNRNSVMNRLFNLFANYNNFTQFSTEVWMTDEWSNADSMESLHDVVHAIVGMDGHMTYLDYSAFDPIFMLHHAMLDRCFALWEALNGNSGYVQPARAVSATFSINIGDTIDSNTPLTPFHMDTNGRPFTSNTSMDTNYFGYTYPELVNNSDSSAVIAKIRALYGNNAIINEGPLQRSPITGVSRIAQAATAQEVHNAPGEITPNGRLQHYVANVVSHKFALSESYAIYMFLGKPQNGDPKSWPLCPNLVGTHAVFTGYAAAAPKSSIKVTGTIPLTDGLLSKVHAGELDGMEPDAVGEYLRQNLVWRVAKMDGTPVGSEGIANLDLAVAVVSAHVQPAESEDEFPSWHDFTEMVTDLAAER